MGISPVPLGLYGDETITACAWISGITGLGFVVRSLTFARPVIDLRALAIRNFSLGWWVSFVTGIGIFTTVYLTPLFLGRVRGFNAQIGMAMLSMIWRRKGNCKAKLRACLV